MKSELKFYALSLLFLGGCGKNAAPKLPDPETDEVIPIKTVAVEQRVMSLPVTGSGFLTSASEQRLAFKIPGVISSVLVDEGDQVKPGQLLAALDLTEINAQVGQAQRAVEKAERDLARVEGLRRDSAATLELLQNATTARDVARENLNIATFNQKYGEIRATRPGRVIKKLMNAGEMAAPGMPIFVLFEEGPSDWVLKTSVSDRDWARLRPGMAARVKLDAFPDVVFSGKITDLPPAADPSNGLYPVEVRVAPSGRRFAPGLFGQAEISVGQGRSYPVVPVEAIVEGNGKEAFVFLLKKDGQSVEKRPVRVAFLEKDRAVIASGLEGVSEVVGIGSPFLSENSKVKLAN